VMFGPVISLVVRFWAPVVSKLALGLMAAKPMESHVHCFSAAWLDVVDDDTMCCALAVWMGVGGCLWPISLRRCLIGIASWALM
jgi:hypothetical protein